MLQNPPGPGQTDYFDDLLARIRDIRSSERRFYQKVLDIYSTSVDYTPNNEASQLIFPTCQDKISLPHRRLRTVRPLRCAAVAEILSTL